MSVTLITEILSVHGFIEIYYWRYGGSVFKLSSCSRHFVICSIARTIQLQYPLNIHYYLCNYPCIKVFALYFSNSKDYNGTRDSMERNDSARRKYKLESHEAVTVDTWGHIPPKPPPLPLHTLFIHVNVLNIN